MKAKLSLILISLLVMNIVCLGIVRADNIPAGLPVSDSNVQQVQDAANQIPLDDQGNINTSKFKPFQSQAELRIEAANKVLGPVTNFLFGSELELSWVFFLSLYLWCAIIIFIRAPVRNILSLNPILAILAAALIATIGMRTLGKKLVGIITLSLNTWWMILIFIVLLAFAMYFYNTFLKSLGATLKAKRKAEEEQEQKDKVNQTARVVDKIIGPGTSRS
jgi:hypothetical protein